MTMEANLAQAVSTCRGFLFLFNLVLYSSVVREGSLGVEPRLTADKLMRNYPMNIPPSVMCKDATVRGMEVVQREDSGSGTCITAESTPILLPFHCFYYICFYFTCFYCHSTAFYYILPSFYS